MAQLPTSSGVFLSGPPTALRLTNNTNKTVVAYLIRYSVGSGHADIWLNGLLSLKLGRADNTIVPPGETHPVESHAPGMSSVAALNAVAFSDGSASGSDASSFIDRFIEIRNNERAFYVSAAANPAGAIADVKASSDPQVGRFIRPLAEELEGLEAAGKNIGELAQTWSARLPEFMRTK